MRLSWPLTGRSGEMRIVESAISTSDVPGIIVAGALGVGKSRIAREALADAAACGCESRWVVGTSAAREIPLGAFTAWTESGITDTVQLVRGAIESVVATSSGATVVLCVDDAHLLDSLSIFVVHQIVQRGAAKVVLTIRDGEPIPEAVQEIWKAAQFDRLDLRPLPLDETTTLLSAALDGPVDLDAATRLWKLARGNVLYLRNIVEQEVTDGRLARQHGYWRWTGEPTLPPGLVEFIESRVGALPTPVRDVIDVLAVGEPIELAALTRITDAAAVEEADTRGLITLESVVGGVEVRVAHPLYSQVRCRRAPPTRLRRLRGLVATALAASANCDDIQTVVRRAALSLDSDLPADAGLLVAAAHGAVWLADLPLADRLASAAVRAGAGPEPNLVRAHALSWLGQGEAAEAVLAEIDAGDLTDVDHARLAFLRASNMLWVLGDTVRAKALIDVASRTISPAAHLYIDAFRTVYWFAMDRPAAAVQASSTLSLDALPAVLGAEIAWALTDISADAGRTTEAVAIAEAGYTAATRSFEAPQMRFNIADAHVSALLLAGRVADALEVAERVRQQAANLPGAAQLIGVAVAGRAALGAGDIGAACALLGRAASGLSESHPVGWGYSYRLPSAIALAMCGAVEAADASLAALDELRRPFRLLADERALARAWVVANQGAVSEAMNIVLSAAEKAAQNQQFAVEVMFLQTATQFGNGAQGPRLRELESIVEGPRVGLAAALAAAVHNGNAAELVTLSNKFEEMGDCVGAIDAAALAALAYRKQDLRGSALICSRRAAGLAQRCGGVSTPALRRAAEPVPLTDREHEIVALIGAGLSNREVADRLTLSVRTVESHIYHAMSRTGTTSRDELAALLPGIGRERSERFGTTLIGTP